jgi:peroxiredoxin
MTLKGILKQSPLVLLAASSLVLNAALSARVLRQQQVIKGLTPPPVVRLGTRVGPVVGTDVAGKAIALQPQSANGTVLYVFAPDCGWCQKNSDNIRVVVDAAVKRGMTVYAVSLVEKGTQEFLSRHHLNVPALVPSETTRQAYGMGGTPQTIVLSSDGAVVRNWKGAYTSTMASDVEHYFSIRLPGLVIPASKS